MPTIAIRLIGSGGTGTQDATVQDWLTTTDAIDMVGTDTIQVGVLWGTWNGSYRTGEQVIADADPQIIFDHPNKATAIDSSHFRCLIGGSMSQLLVHLNAIYAQVVGTDWRPGANDLRFDPTIRNGYDATNPNQYARLVRTMTNTSGNVITIREPFVCLEALSLWLDGDPTAGTHYCVEMESGATDCIIDGVFGAIELGGGAAILQNFRTQLGSDRNDWRNCIAVGSSTRDDKGSQIGFSGSGSGVGDLQNCGATNIRSTINGGGYGFAPSASQVLKACVSVRSGTADYNTASGALMLRCASGDDSLPLTGVNFTGIVGPAAMVDPEFWDMRPRVNSTLIQNGYAVGDVIGGNWAPLTDYSGAIREVFTDIGPHQGGVVVPVGAATRVVSRIGAGLDYPDLATWITATAQNLVTGEAPWKQTVQVAELWEDQNISSELVVGLDASNTAIANSRYYREITAAPHLYGRVYVQGGTAGALIRNYGERHFHWSGGVIYRQTTGGNLPRKCIRSAGAFSVIDGVKTVQTNPVSGGNAREDIDIEIGEGQVVRNSVCVGLNDVNNGASRGIRLRAPGAIAYNNTCRGYRQGTNGNGVHMEDATSLAVNNIVADCLACFAGPGRQSHNVSTDATATGFRSQTNAVASELFADVASTDPESWDLRNRSGSVALGIGAVLTRFFSTDHDGEIRSLPWDIGAYAGVARPPTLPMVETLTKKMHRYAVAWAIDREDGLSFSLTQHSSDLEALGRRFSAGIVSDSDRQVEAGFRDSSTELQGAISSDRITEADLLADLFRGARALESVVDWRYPYAAPFKEFLHYIDQAEFTSSGWTFQLAGMSSRLTAKVGGVLSRDCRNDLGDAFCQVDVVPLSVYNKAVSSVVNDQRVFRALETDFPQSTYPDEYFEFGLIEWLSGPKAGTVSQCKVYRQGATEVTFELIRKTTFDIEVGDRFNAIVGCDQKFLTCSAKFGNILRYRGIEHAPGASQLLAPPER